MEVDPTCEAAGRAQMQNGGPDPHKENRRSSRSSSSPKNSSEFPVSKSMPGSPNKPPRKDSTLHRKKHQQHQQQAPPQSSVLVRLAKSFNASPQKALEYALQAVKFFEENSRGEVPKRDLELTLSLHALAAVHCRMRHYGEAMTVLQRSLKVPNLEGGGLEHALAVFAGHMHIGDTFSLMGKLQESLDAYHTALDLQIRVLGDKDLRVAQTCRYLAEAHLQNFQLKEAEEVCGQLLRIHAQIGKPASLEEAADRRLMALICSGKGDHETALEYLVLASMALISSGGQDLDVAAVEVSIGDTYVALERFEDAVFAYQKALTVFKSANGEDHISVASVYVSLANLYLKTGKQREARTYCESALKLYSKHEIRHPLDEITSGLTEVAALYGVMEEHEKALQLLIKVLDIVEAFPGQHNVVAAIEAQMGVLYFVLGKFGEALMTFKSAVMKLRTITTSLSPSEQRNSFLGMLLNQMGLACVELYEIVDAAQCFQEAKNILEQASGPNHVDTIAVSANLAATYDALGRLDDAINLLRDIIKAKEAAGESLEVDDDKRRLNELLKEAGH